MESRLPGIQVGRAIAAASVFYFHSYIALGYFDATRLKTFGWLATHGASGVDFFFAISGFIVCHVAARPGFTPLGFLAKRFFRIYPLNAVVTIAMMAIVLYGIRISDDVSVVHVIQSILILPQKAPVNSVGWTLEYEVAFYLIAAALLPRGGPRALFVYCAVSHVIGTYSAPQSPIVARFITEHHAAFGAGVLAYMIVVKLPKMPTWTAWLASVALPIAGLAVFQSGGLISTPLLTPAGCCLAVVGAALLPYAPKWIVKLGDISYGFYLLHWPLIGLAGWAAFAVVTPNHAIGEIWRWNVFIYTWLLAYLLWIYLERPINRWAHRSRSVNRIRDDVARERSGVNTVLDGETAFVRERVADVR